MSIFHEHRSLFLLISILTFLFISPLMRLSESYMMWMGIGWTLLIGFSGYWMTERHRWMWVMAAFVAIAAVAYLADVMVVEHLAIARIHLLVLAITLRHALFNDDNSPLDCVIAGVCGYFLIALLFGNIYHIALDIDPKAIDGLSSTKGIDSSSVIYYSIVTLTTQGYGDIVPINPFTRICAAVQGALGTIYLAVLVASLVTELRRGIRKHRH